MALFSTTKKKVRQGTILKNEIHKVKVGKYYRVGFQNTYGEQKEVIGKVYDIDTHNKEIQLKNSNSSYALPSKEITYVQKVDKNKLARYL